MRHSSAASAKRRVRARPGEGERLREEIIEAATALLVESGDESAVSVRAVAKAVGCTPAAIYLHFDDRAQLVFAVCERQFARLADEIDRAVADVDEPSAALRALARAYIRFGLDHPGAYRALFMGHPAALPTDDTPEHVLASGGFGRVVAAVRAAMDAGVVRRDDPFDVAVVLWVGVHGLTSLLISKPGFPWPAGDDFVDRFVDEQLEAFAP